MRFFILILVFVGGAFLVALGAGQWGHDPLSPLWVVIGVSLMIGVIVLLRRQGREKRADLYAGKDVVARWQLSQADLDAFHLLNQQRSGGKMALRNLVSIPKKAPPEGVPVIIGKANWLVGTRLYDSAPGGALLCNVATFDGDPGFIEIATVSRSSGSGYYLVLSRLPYPGHARAAALTAAASLSARVPRQNFERLLRSFPDYARNVSPQIG